MVVDSDTNVVFVADTLERQFPVVYRCLASILNDHAIPLLTIFGTRQVWCRDYMPVQVGEDRFVQFRYAPDYLTGRYRHLRADGEIGPRLPWLGECVRSEIVLDGGNVVRWKDAVILTDKIVAENGGWGRRGLEARLRRALRVERVLFIPSEPGDAVGHSDGIVRFVDGGRVLTNDYRHVDGRDRRELLRVLEREGLEVIEVPYRPRHSRDRSIPSAFGCYLNYLQAGRLIVLPTFGLPEDDQVLSRIRVAFPDSTVVRSVGCRELSEEGGVLNCVTWTIRCRSRLRGDCPDPPGPRRSPYAPR